MDCLCPVTLLGRHRYPPSRLSSCLLWTPRPSSKRRHPRQNRAPRNVDWPSRKEGRIMIQMGFLYRVTVPGRPRLLALIPSHRRLVVSLELRCPRRWHPLQKDFPRKRKSRAPTTDCLCRVIHLALLQHPNGTR
jgi:hypothetical protein